ncbi:hypothetical protein NQ317_015357 [Molorchus minor]|uniref:Uncharacterized protein n=1 Tax=Molorchus minor TaxID=1323400 RepID=A0ABQ9J2W4_9CUCU|nr:hypothetical protein NQ317_015357 [Molorchus minor]
MACAPPAISKTNCKIFRRQPQVMAFYRFKCLAILYDRRMILSEMVRRPVRSCRGIGSKVLWVPVQSLSFQQYTHRNGFPKIFFYSPGSANIGRIVQLFFTCQTHVLCLQIRQTVLFT